MILYFINCNISKKYDFISLPLLNSDNLNNLNNLKDNIFLKDLSYLIYNNSSYLNTLGKFFVTDFFVDFNFGDNNCDDFYLEKLKYYENYVKSYKGEDCYEFVDKISKSLCGGINRRRIIEELENSRIIRISNYTCVTFNEKCGFNSHSNSHSNSNCENEIKKFVPQLKRKINKFVVDDTIDKMSLNLFEEDCYFNYNSKISENTKINLITNEKLIKIKILINDTLNEFEGLDIFYDDYNFRKKDVLQNILDSVFNLGNKNYFQNNFKKSISFLLDYSILRKQFFKNIKMNISDNFILINLFENFFTFYNRISKMDIFFQKYYFMNDDIEDFQIVIASFIYNEDLNKNWDEYLNKHSINNKFKEYLKINYTFLSGSFKNYLMDYSDEYSKTIENIIMLKNQNKVVIKKYKKCLKDQKKEKKRKNNTNKIVIKNNTNKIVLKNNTNKIVLKNNTNKIKNLSTSNTNKIVLLKNNTNKIVIKNNTNKLNITNKLVIKNLNTNNFNINKTIIKNNQTSKLNKTYKNMTHNDNLNISKLNCTKSPDIHVNIMINKTSLMKEIVNIINEALKNKTIISNNLPAIVNKNETKIEIPPKILNITKNVLDLIKVNKTTFTESLKNKAKENKALTKLFKNLLNPKDKSSNFLSMEPTDLNFTISMRKSFIKENKKEDSLTNFNKILQRNLKLISNILEKQMNTTWEIIDDFKDKEDIYLKYYNKLEEMLLEFNQTFYENFVSDEVFSDLTEIITKLNLMSIFNKVEVKGYNEIKSVLEFSKKVFNIENLILNETKNIEYYLINWDTSVVTFNNFNKLNLHLKNLNNLNNNLTHLNNQTNNETFYELDLLKNEIEILSEIIHNLINQDDSIENKILIENKINETLTEILNLKEDVDDPSIIFNMIYGDIYENYLTIIKLITKIKNKSELLIKSFKNNDDEVASIFKLDKLTFTIFYYFICVVLFLIYLAIFNRMIKYGKDFMINKNYKLDSNYNKFIIFFTIFGFSFVMFILSRLVYKNNILVCLVYGIIGQLMSGGLIFDNEAGKAFGIPSFILNGIVVGYQTGLHYAKIENRIFILCLGIIICYLVGESVSHIEVFNFEKEDMIRNPRKKKDQEMNN